MDSTTQRKFVLAASSLSIFGAGILTGALLSKSKYQSLYSDLAEQEIAEAKAFYQKPNPVELAQKLELPDTLLGDPMTQLKELTRDYRYEEEEIKPELTVVETPEEEPIAVVENVFTTATDVDPEWDQIAEETSRGSDPYIISHEEFMLNEPEHEQITITYYEGDGVLADETDSTIEDEDSVIGSDSNLRFGHGSKDHNIVYIRNEAVDTDFEVLRSNGKYAEEVLGFVEHSEIDRRRQRKFRLNDE